MSSHCSRYPNCGCAKNCGTKCQLPEGDHRLLEKEIERNEKGYPLSDDGSIDWELTSKEKEAIREKCERMEGGIRVSKHRKHATNYTPPKKRKRG